MKSFTKAKKYHELIKYRGITFRECGFHSRKTDITRDEATFEINNIEWVESVFAKVFLATVGGKIEKIRDRSGLELLEETDERINEPIFRVKFYVWNWGEYIKLNTWWIAYTLQFN